MTLWQRIKDAVRRLMQGRHGADEFSLALLILGVALSMLASITHLYILELPGIAAYGYSMFRILSRNNAKRYAENRWFLSRWKGCANSVRQFFVRLKNIGTYKYFKCPQCHARLRLPRKVGEVTVTCGKCRHSFKQRA